MKAIAQEILDWTEVWAPLIPLTVLVIRKPKHNWVKPVTIYLVLAFVICLTSNVIWKRIDLGLEGWMKVHLSSFYNTYPPYDFQNTLFYNIHSILRFLLFAWFFSYLGRVFRKMNMVIPPLYIIGVAIVFVFFEDIRDFNGPMLGAEASLLLIYSLVYYFLMLRNEETQIKRQPGFWVVTGLSIYMVINFPIFLFYNKLAEQAELFAIDIWDVHNIAYIVMCTFIAKAFYG